MEVSIKDSVNRPVKVLKGSLALATYVTWQITRRELKTIRLWLGRKGVPKHVCKSDCELSNDEMEEKKRFFKKGGTY